MIDPRQFIELLQHNRIDRFFGVPDSLLAEFCCELDAEKNRHVLTANEGNAVAMAIGHHLATGRHACVYMQNSGLGNAVNPITSLAAGEIYRIGMLLLIGWRGEPGRKDEPQHVVQGRVTQQMLETLNIRYQTLQHDSDPQKILAELLAHIKNGPVALLVRAGTFAPSELKAKKLEESHLLKREKFIELMLDELEPKDLIVATTGKTSRELFELRARRNEQQRDFLTVGGMGHCASIALGLAMSRPQQRIFCLDGDGAMLMHLGALTTIGAAVKPENYVYILLNNGSHESVGGQPTIARSINLRQLAGAVGFANFFSITNSDQVSPVFAAMRQLAGPIFVEVLLQPGSRKDLGRPNSTPEENKMKMMRFINEC